MASYVSTYSFFPSLKVVCLAAPIQSLLSKAVCLFSPWIMVLEVSINVGSFMQFWLNKVIHEYHGIILGWVLFMLHFGKLIILPFWIRGVHVVRSNSNARDTVLSRHSYLFKWHQRVGLSINASWFYGGSMKTESSILACYIMEKNRWYRGKGLRNR